MSFSLVRRKYNKNRKLAESFPTLYKLTDVDVVFGDRVIVVIIVIFFVATAVVIIILPDRNKLPISFESRSMQYLNRH